jgi:hypothetical protein
VYIYSDKYYINIYVYTVFNRYRLYLYLNNEGGAESIMTSSMFSQIFKQNSHSDTLDPHLTHAPPVSNPNDSGLLRIWSWTQPRLQSAAANQICHLTQSSSAAATGRRADPRWR